MVSTDWSRNVPGTKFWRGRGGSGVAVSRCWPTIWQLGICLGCCGCCGCYSCCGIGLGCYSCCGIATPLPQPHCPAQHSSVPAATACGPPPSSWRRPSPAPCRRPRLWRERQAKGGGCRAEGDSHMVGRHRRKRAVWLAAGQHVCSLTAPTKTAAQPHAARSPSHTNSLRCDWMLAKYCLASAAVEVPRPCAGAARGMGVDAEVGGAGQLVVRQMQWSTALLSQRPSTCVPAVRLPSTKQRPFLPPPPKPKH